MIIEKNMRMDDVRKEHALTVYPWKSMEIGDSFLFPKGYGPSTAHAMAWQRSHGWKDKKKFKVIATPDGMRCWRVE